jgi:hypothetical protein
MLRLSDGKKKINPLSVKIRGWIIFGEGVTSSLPLLFFQSLKIILIII